MSETFKPEFRREKLLDLLRRFGPLSVTQIWDQLPFYEGGEAPLILDDLRALGRSVRKIDGFWRGNNNSPYWADSWTATAAGLTEKFFDAWVEQLD